MEAEKIALSILKQVMEEKLTSSNVEIVAITPMKDSKGLCFSFHVNFFSFKIVDEVKILFLVQILSGRLTGRFERLSKEQLDALIAEL